MNVFFRRVWLPFSLAIACAPGIAAAQFNTPPTVSAVTVSPTPVPASSSATITCFANDTDGTINTLILTVTGGTLPAGGLTQSVPISPAASVTGALAWTTPIPGNYTVTCTATDNGGSFAFPATRQLAVPVVVQVPPAGSPPVIDQVVVSAVQVTPGAQVQLGAAAHDPDGAPVTFAWSASGGTLSPAADAATWTAPSQGGSYTITLVVADGSGFTVSTSVSISVASDVFTAALPAPGSMPRRLALIPGGDLGVVDAVGSLSILTPAGTLKGTIALPEPAAALAACAGRLVVATSSGRALLFDFQGRAAGVLALSGGALAGPTGMACDPVTGLLFIAERRAGRVRAVWPDGTTAYEHTAAGLVALEAPADVAVDATARRLLVLLESNQAGFQVHTFGLDGLYVGGAVPFGGSAGSVTRGAGLAVAPSGRFYVADSFQGVVQTYDASGAARGMLGSFGATPGQLAQPSGLAITPRGDLFVANTGNGRLEVFGTGAPLPACASDADCDGLPDAWEVAHGLNATDARDAFADVDGDGLSNAEEFAWNTDPRRADTDGDGWSDGEEVALGFNPVLGTDHAPVLLTVDAASDPGLVQFSGTISGRGTCSVSWAQSSGPTVTLRGAGTTTPTFVGRQAGTYTFLGTPRCNGVDGAAAPVEAIVHELAPISTPGPRRAVALGETTWLDGLASWDPNGGTLSSSWDQLLGPPLLAATHSPSTMVRSWQPGLSVFALTTTDGAGLTSTAEVPVLVVDPAKVALTAVVDSPVTTRVGRVVTLDASASLVPQGAPPAYAWRQLDGPAAPITSATLAVASFVPSLSGRYRFEVTLRQGLHVTAPEVVDVYVSDPQLGLPVASAPTQVAATVGEPLRLSGSASSPNAPGAVLDYRWRQVSGAAAGLTHKDEVSALVVPFVAGTSFFELTVLEGATESLPVVVRVDADRPGLVRPVAVVTAPAVETAHIEVALDGTGSTSQSGALAWRWSQVSGPWVALTGARSSVAVFTPRAPGLYVFQLEVRDGAVWSAPTTSAVLVFPQPSSGGGRQP